MPSHSFHVERLMTVTMRDFRPDVLKEQAGEGWVLVDTLDATEKGAFTAMDEWFTDNNPEVGRYRLMEFTPYGGTFVEFEVKQKLILEEVKRLTEVA